MDKVDVSKSRNLWSRDPFLHSLLCLAGLYTKKKGTYGNAGDPRLPA